MDSNDYVDKLSYILAYDKKFGIDETLCGSDGTLITSILDRLRQWLKFAEDQCSWSIILATSAILFCFSCPMMTNMPNEEVHKGLKVTSCNKSPKPWDLSLTFL